MVPSICLTPEAGLWVWLFSNWERMSAKFSCGSAGSSAGASAAGSGSASGDGIVGAFSDWLGRGLSCGRDGLFAGGFGRIGGGLGLWNGIDAHDVYCSIVPR